MACSLSTAQSVRTNKAWSLNDLLKLSPVAVTSHFCLSFWLVKMGFQCHQPSTTEDLQSWQHMTPSFLRPHYSHRKKGNKQRERERQRQHAHNAERERGGWIGGLRSIKYLQHRQRGKTDICKCWGCSIDLHKDTRQEPDWGLVIKHQISWLLILILTMCVCVSRRCHGGGDPPGVDRRHCEDLGCSFYGTTGPV